MTRPYFLTIQKKFLLVFLIIGMIPAAAGVILTVGGSRLSYAWATGNGLELRVREIADRTGQLCEDRHATLRSVLLANDFELLRTRLDSTAIRSAEVLIRYRAGEDPYAVPLTQGAEPLARIVRGLEPYFAELVQSGRIPAEGMIDDVYLKDGTWNGDPGLILFIYPREEGRRELFAFATSVRRVLDEVRTSLGQDSLVSVYSRKGYFLALPPGNLELLPEARERFPASSSATAGWFNVSRRESERRQWFLIAHSPVPRISKLSVGSVATASPWVIFLIYDMESFLGPQSTLIASTFFIAIVWLLVLMGISVYVTRRVVGPVKQLRYQAEAMASGDLTAQARVRTRDEIQDLANAFNTMSRKLRKSHSDLESRVEESRLRADHIAVINEITKAITQALDLDRTFEILKRELPKILPYDALWIALPDKETGKLRVTHAEPEDLIRELSRGTVPLEYSFHGQSLRELKAAHGVIGPQDDSDPSQSGVFTLLGFRSFLVAPLPSMDRALGTVTAVSRQDGVYGHEEVEILSSVASGIAVGIEQAELFRQTRAFAEELERKVEERTRELERANKELIQAEKYAATGRLGANLAHEINNPLGIIKNYLRISSDAIQRTGTAGEAGPNPEHLKIIEEEIDRIARIVRKLLDLHRPADENPQRTDIAGMIQDIMALMERDLEQKGIEFHCDLAANMPHPMVAPDLIRQVYINLIRNAEDAMPEGGTLTIEARESRLGAGEHEKPAIEVSIEDTGTGIDAEAQKHLFEPFYTTKAPDRGTGLGLYVSYGIVQRYHGTIEVESEEGKGTTFRVSVPVDPAPAPEALIATGTPPPGGATSD